MADGIPFIGTSGWNYKHWINAFYPESVNKKEWFSYYQTQFSTVEVNNTFYKLPRKETFRKWKDESPGDFLFSLKASRYITHMKKLKDPRQSTKKFFDASGVLEDKLGPVLFQLPPKWRKNTGRLESLIKVLPAEYLYTFEFRDRSWFDEDVYDVLKGGNAALCIYHLKGELSPKEVTADFIYIRLHGPDGAYQGSYDSKELGAWAGAISAWTRSGKDVYCYFDNDQRGYAPQNALELKKMVEG